MADFLNTTISGLKSFQRALDVTGHNISNANTEGYSRQRVELSTREPQMYGTGYVGSGVRVSSITRSYDQFLVQEQRNSVSSHSRSEAYYDLARQVDNIVADPDAGLSPSLSSFFDSVQNLADNPNSSEARQVLLSEGDNLADRFHYLDQRLQGLETRVNGDLRNAVKEINTLSENIAALNADIIRAEGRNGQPPNDLLDQRDQAILDLSKYVDVDTIQQDNGSVNVMVGQGQPLVVGTNASALSVDEGGYPGSGRLELSLGGAQITDYFSGGKVEGMLDFRDDILQPTRNTLGQTAIGLAQEFNAQHSEGLDLNGDLGGAFFQFDDPEVFAADGNSAAADSTAVTVSISDHTALTASDYTLRREDDSGNKVWKLYDQEGTTVTTSSSGTFTAEGLSFNAPAPSNAGLNDGDSFLIRPTHEGAGSIDTVISDTNKIAAAAPLRSSAQIDSAGVPSNTGDGTISEPAVLDETDANFFNSVTLEMGDSDSDGVVDQYSTDGGTTWTAYTLGDDISMNGWKVQVNGAPDAGDEFVVEKNSDAPGDNSNALALAALQTQGYLDNGSSSAQDNYGQLVADIGVKTRQSEINVKAQEQRMQQANDAKESVSGVNLDEEAAKLMEYQQAYQAAAKAIRAADEMFQTLLNAV